MDNNFGAEEPEFEPDLPWQPDYDMLGFSLVGPPPLGVVHVPWDRELIVLYGRNGAGKSTILNGVRAALSGVAARSEAWAFLHLRLRSASAPTVWNPEGEGLGMDIHLAVKNELYERWREDAAWEQRDVTDLEEFRAIHDSESVTSLIRIDLMRRGYSDGLCDEIGCSGVFSLVTTGDEREPRWDLYLSGYPTEDSPQLRKLLAEEASSDLHLAVTPWRGAFVGPLPAWVPVPAVLLKDGFPAFYLPDLLDVAPTVIDRKAEALAALTADTVAGGQRLLEEDNDSLRPRPGATGALTAVSQEASSMLQRFLDDPPTLVARLASPASWTDGRQVVWEAIDLPSGGTVPLEVLSDAEWRWAEIAIRLVLRRLQDRSHGYGVLLLDEPERALHSRVLPRLVEGIGQIPDFINGPVYAATHAAPFLESSATKLVHVRRDGLGETELAPLQPVTIGPLSEMAERLGVDRGDLLRLFSVFLVVEGAHDQAVVEEVLGDDLAASRVRVVPMRGARRALSVAESEVLLDFTDARILIALDRIRPSLQALIESVTTLAGQGDALAAIRQLETVLARLQRDPGERLGAEALTACAVIRQSLESGTWRRVEVFGFSKPDIILYLPVDALVPGATSWERLEKDWRHSATRLDFKTWIAAEKGAIITVESIQRAARLLTAATLHPDFSRLLQACSHADRSTGSNGAL